MYSITPYSAECIPDVFSGCIYCLKTRLFLNLKLNCTHCLKPRVIWNAIYRVLIGQFTCYLYMNMLLLALLYRILVTIFVSVSLFWTALAMHMLICY